LRVFKRVIGIRLKRQYLGACRCVEPNRHDPRVSDFRSGYRALYSRYQLFQLSAQSLPIRFGEVRNQSSIIAPLGEGVVQPNDCKRY
jgi:hypothetical protein